MAYTSQPPVLLFAACAVLVPFYWRSAYRICRREIPLNSFFEAITAKNFECNRIIWSVILGRAKYRHIPRDKDYYIVKYGIFVFFALTILQTH